MKKAILITLEEETITRLDDYLKPFGSNRSFYINKMLMEKLNEVKNNGEQTL